MPVCPLCEHAQPDGAECEVCGKRLPAPQEAQARAEAPMEELEPTLHGAVATTTSALPEMETTRHPPAHAAVEPLELEPTRAAPVDPPVEAMADVERTELGLPGDDRTALPAQLTCRYCRSPAGPGDRVCARCGMRLPVFGAPAARDLVVRRCGCGAEVRGSLCPACGALAS